MSGKIIILHATDFHYTRRNPRSRSDSFGEAILAKLSELVRTGNKIDAAAIAISGDLFDRKGDVTTEETADMARVLARARVPVLAIMGNHDQIGYRPESLPKTGYGVLVAAGLIHHLDDTPFFIRRNGLTVAVSGTSYRDGVDRDGRESYFPERLECDFQVHLTHGYLLDVRQSIIEEFTPYTSVTGTEADCILNGHYHPEQKTKRVMNGREGCVIISPGAASRGALTSDNFDRMPRMTILRIDADGIKHSIRPFRCAKPSSEVLKFEEKAEAKERATKLEEFAEGLREATDFEETLTPEELLAAVGEDMPEFPEEVSKDEVMLEAKRYLESAGASA